MTGWRRRAVGATTIPPSAAAPRFDTSAPCSACAARLTRRVAWDLSPRRVCSIATVRSPVASDHTAAASPASESHGRLLTRSSAGQAVRARRAREWGHSCPDPDARVAGSGAAREAPVVVRLFVIRTWLGVGWYCSTTLQDKQSKGHSDNERKNRASSHSSCTVIANPI